MARGSLEELIQPLKDDPERSAVLLDVDGVLAPIVQHPDDAHMPETTRRPLIEVAKRYGVVACVSGRRASDARRVVSLGSIAYLGSHGSEILRPGSIAPEMDRELQAWTRRVQNFAREAYTESLRKLRVRLEDKEAIAALHWRDVPDEEEAEAAVREVAEAAEKAGFNAHWGRKVLEIRPPVRIDKGAGIVSLLRDVELEAALYVGDDTTDIDAFRGLTELVELGSLKRALQVGVRSGDETPSALEAEADVMVDGTDGVRDLLRALHPLSASSVRFVDFLKATVLLSAGAATLLAALTVISLARDLEPLAVYVAAGWWLVAARDRRLAGAAGGGEPADRAAAGDGEGADDAARAAAGADDRATACGRCCSRRSWPA